MLLCLQTIYTLFRFRSCCRDRYCRTHVFERRGDETRTVQDRDVFWFQTGLHLSDLDVANFLARPLTLSSHSHPTGSRPRSPKLKRKGVAIMQVVGEICISLFINRVFLS
jgi:hypothetical protein